MLKRYVLNLRLELHVESVRSPDRLRQTVPNLARSPNLVPVRGTMYWHVVRTGGGTKTLTSWIVWSIQVSSPRAPY